MHTVVETPPFLAAAKAAGMTDEVRRQVVDAIARDPELGTIMEGTGGFRKFRLAKPGRGKRGGFRVVSYHHSEGLPVFLITVFGKNEKDNLTKAERNALHGMSTVLAANYKAKAERKVKT